MLLPSAPIPCLAPQQPPQPLDPWPGAVLGAGCMSAGPTHHQHRRSCPPHRPKSPHPAKGLCSSWPPGKAQS